MCPPDLTFFADKYCLSLKELDLNDLIKAFNKHPDSLDNVYPCLTETVVKFCRNLQKNSEVCIISESLNLASQNCLEGLLYLTSVSFDWFIEMPILYSLVNEHENFEDMP